MSAYELVLPDFFDADALRVHDVTYRIDNQGERLYARKVDDALKVVPSVSAVLSQFGMDRHLVKWYCSFPDYQSAREYVTRRAEYGTFMHMLFKDILLGYSLAFNSTALGQSFEEYLKSVGKTAGGHDLEEVGQNLKQDLWGFVQFCKTYKVKPLAIEYIAFGEQYAGAIDLVCKMTLTKTRKVDNMQSERMFAFLPLAGEVVEEREVVAMIDFKSGRKDFSDDNALQLHAYRELWNAEQPTHQIELLANYGCKDYRLPVRVEPYRFKQYKDSLETASKWQLMVDLYHTRPIEIKDRLEFTEAATISLESDLPLLIEKIDIEKQIIEKAGKDDGENTERKSGDEVAGDRENQNRRKGSNSKREGTPIESGLF